MNFGAKIPGTQMEIRQVSMDFSYTGSFTETSPEAYERLILDMLLGDPRCFRSSVKWSFLADPRPGARYVGRRQAAGAVPRRHVGPRCADEMLARDGFAWRRP